MSPAFRSLCARTLASFALVAACSSGGEGDSRDNVDGNGAGGSWSGVGGVVSSAGGSTWNPGTGGAANPGAGGMSPPGPGCGNGTVDPGEECDGIPTTTCAAVTMNALPVGTPLCTGCRIDASTCASGSGSGAGGALTGTGGGAGAGNVPSNTGGMMGQAGSGSSSGGSASGAGGAPIIDGVDGLRQLCVDTINNYRATVGLGPMSRATASQEACSDQGAQLDATTGDAHGSAGSCDGLGAQNTCPGWNPTRYGGVAGALTACLQTMWREGEPPVPRSQCTGTCFQTYGHYLNMTSNASVVSCGFYNMPNGSVWMNQDFGR